MDVEGKNGDTSRVGAYSMSDSGSPMTLTAPRRSCGQKTKAHFKKWWWLHLIIFIAVTLILVLCITYVAAPRIAQSGINDSTLNITSLEVTNPTSHSVDIVLDSVIRSSNSYHPTLDAFTAVLSMAGSVSRPFGNISLPSIRSDVEVPVHVAQTMTFSNMGDVAFGDYNKALLTGATAQQIVAGTTWLHLGGLPAYQVTYNKTVELKGFNNLEGFNITTFTLLSNGAENRDYPGKTYNAKGMVSIPNPTVLTLELGNITYHNTVDGTDVGESLLPNVVLKPGNNTLPMLASVSTEKVLPLVAGKYQNGKLPVKSEVVSVQFHREDLVYYKDALAASPQTVMLNVLAALGTGKLS